MHLYVGNIPVAATEQEIKDHFREYGVGNVKIIIDRATGRSKGYCFIEVPDREARRVMEELHKTNFMGSIIAVKHVRSPQPEKSDSWKYKYIAHNRKH